MLLGTVRGGTTYTSRVTYFTLQGVMASGLWTFDGAAACGWAIPLFSWIHVVEPDVWLQCLDTGLLGATQIDAWACCGRPWWLDDDWYSVEVDD